MAKPVNWGIIGTGQIAEKFAQACGYVKDAQLLAVGSRTQSSADKFGQKHNIPRRYANYRDLAEDADVQAVYISTPHNLHMDNALLCLNAGKAVLCEKPFTINAFQADKVLKTASRNNCFIMEAMWNRFLPVMTALRDLLKKNVIGAPEILTANFGFKAVYKPDHRLFNPALGGGALLDIGVYNVSLSSMLFGSPLTVNAIGHIGKTGVDEKIAVLLGYSENRFSLLHASIRSQTSHEAEIVGGKGRIKIHSPWWHPTKMTVYVPGSKEQVIDLPYEGTGHNYEIMEVNKCLRKGKTESKIMPHDETLSIMETMDNIRNQIGLKYPEE
ncbi:Gfo/Idh/MocA family oxidoreductase [candidate division KSB1 bacterium]|nr:Gfo/Idh/MocA family oxidoreductase [candidate division KSB1 bacterium]